jgi:NAD(P)-dependent dehydrogenase (short-subunit alcohol dehydrogenase family)
MRPGNLELPDLTGKTILVTGASSGIGLAAARRFAAAGATVLIHGRSPDRTTAVARQMGAEPFVADFARLDDVYALAQRILDSTTRLDVILHNAGALVARRTVTADGHELTFQANHLAPFLLQQLLGPLVLSTPNSRIVVTSSRANLRGSIHLDDLDSQRSRYSGFGAYATSKLENILFVRELARRIAGRMSSAVAVHPGNVATAFGGDSFFPGLFYRMPGRKLYLIAPERGAEPLLRLATMLDVSGASGLYYARFKPRGSVARQADDAELARGLWERSLEMVKPWLDAWSEGRDSR